MWSLLFTQILRLNLKILSDQWYNTERYYLLFIMSPETLNNHIPADGEKRESENYYDREIRKLNKEIEETEKERDILRDLESEIPPGSHATEEVVQSYVARIAELARFKNTDPERYTRRLFKDRELGLIDESPFAESFEAFEELIETAKDEIRRLEKEREEEEKDV